jgi:hypothetical protein
VLAGGGMSVPSLVEVHLLQLPVPLWSKAQQLNDELLREFALAALQSDDDADHHLPARLTTLMDVLTTQFDGVSSAQQEQLAAAAAAGQEVIDDLVFRVPAEAAPASRMLGDMLDEADEYCREGQHLLTLAAPEDVVRFRRWYLMAFIDQCGGAAPVPWPEFDGTWAA